MLRRFEVKLVSAWQSVLQTKTAGRFKHLDVQIGEVSPISGSEPSSIGSHLQYAEASGTRDGEGQKSAAHGAGYTGTDRSTSTS